VLAAARRCKYFAQPNIDAVESLSQELRGTRTPAAVRHWRIWYLSRAALTAATWHGADMRVSTFPTVHGEKAVVRVFEASAQTHGLEQLGLPAAVLQGLEALLRERTGAVFLPREDQHLPDEPYHVGGLLLGAVRPPTWRDPQPLPADFFAVRGVPQEYVLASTTGEEQPVAAHREDRDRRGERAEGA